MVTHIQIDDRPACPRNCTTYQQYGDCGHQRPSEIVDLKRDLATPAAERGRVPIPMILYCPACALQHIDAPQPEKEWTNPPHRSHECQGCGCVWRPADVPTVGVASIATRGSRDSGIPERDRALLERLPSVEEIAGLISTLDFRPAGEHPDKCGPIATALRALLRETL